MSFKFSFVITSIYTNINTRLYKKDDNQTNKMTWSVQVTVEKLLKAATTEYFHEKCSHKCENRCIRLISAEVKISILCQNIAYIYCNLINSAG